MFWSQKLYKYASNSTMATVRSRVKYFLRPEQNDFRNKLNLLRSVTMIGRATLLKSLNTDSDWLSH